MTSNGDIYREFKVGNQKLCGLGSFHKTLAHNKFGEVDPVQFERFVEATEGIRQFSTVPRFNDAAARLVNPQAGLANDRLTPHPSHFSMPPAPGVLSVSTAAEMTELYWMALLRDVPFNEFEDHKLVAKSAKEIGERFTSAASDAKDVGRIRLGVDVPGSTSALDKITPQNVFRMGLAGEEIGPLISQFFMRDAFFGTQTIDQRQRPYKSNLDFLTDFDTWLSAQNLAKDADGQAYSSSNEKSSDNYELNSRYIATMRDLARYVNKDALHQAYFIAALLLLSGGAKWNQGNPYGDFGPPEFGNREAGFGTLGGPHLLALVSEVATRVLKVVWHQKWQVHLRLRPEAYGGLVHVQSIGIGPKKEKRSYGLPSWVSKTEAAKLVQKKYGRLLLPMAFTTGSPAHPSYGAGHAVVAGACVTILKAYFQTFDRLGGKIVPKPLTGDGGLSERLEPYGKGIPFRAFVTGKDESENGLRTELPSSIASQLTIEGELNKLASNVAMGRGMGGVHWRTDNTRSLTLGEALAAKILADITTDLNERPRFEFRSFSRDASGNPKLILVQQGQVRVNGILMAPGASEL